MIYIWTWLQATTLQWILQICSLHSCKGCAHSVLFGLPVSAHILSLASVCTNFFHSAPVCSYCLFILYSGFTICLILFLLLAQFLFLLLTQCLSLIMLMFLSLCILQLSVLFLLFIPALGSVLSSSVQLSWKRFLSFSVATLATVQ